jgi:hypothetical protein
MDCLGEQSPKLSAISHRNERARQSFTPEMQECAVTHYVGNFQAKGPGQKDKQGRQSDLVDRRAGAYDRITEKSPHPMEEHTTAHEAAQAGADVRPETEPSDEGVPEGLRRKPKHPVNPHTGRGDVPPQVPDWKPGGGS